MLKMNFASRQLALAQKRSRMDISFCHNVPFGSSKFKTKINVTLEPDTLSAFSKNNLCKTPIISHKKEKISSRHCEIKNII